MGVHGLWKLLSAQGRRVSVESLRNKRLAVDVSIWLTSFMKAMRDDQGRMLPNAHIIGVFRRVCKVRCGLKRRAKRVVPPPSVTLSWTSTQLWSVWLSDCGGTVFALLIDAWLCCES